MDGLLVFLGDILSGLISGSPPKSNFVRWTAYAINAIIIILSGLLIYGKYLT
ncbi:hypothetical protein CFBP7129_06315 [Agrobacterium tumefaciens]|uniref:Uncharacterized protein n=1 Tax=Agrobacterium tumefaciens TaxID=358 RepID=A0A4D7YRK0_AGRTU|nr:hypothetical protein CFBP7129_06315 [Agrobacterium tumefaciens]